MPSGPTRESSIRAYDPEKPPCIVEQPYSFFWVPAFAADETQILRVRFHNVSALRRNLERKDSRCFACNVGTTDLEWAGAGGVQCVHRACATGQGAPRKPGRGSEVGADVGF